MRLLIAIVFLLIVTVSHAQDGMRPLFSNDFGRLSDEYTSYSKRTKLNDTLPIKKWSITTYSGISTGISFWKGGHASTFSVPLGLQLTRTLSNNLFAFGAVSAAPSYVNFNRSFINADVSKFGAAPFMRSNNLGLYSRAELGLGYINDERTFQISASFGVERNNYPFYMPQMGTQKQYMPSAHK